MRRRVESKLLLFPLFVSASHSIFVVLQITFPFPSTTGSTFPGGSPVWLAAVLTCKYISKFLLTPTHLHNNKVCPRVDLGLELEVRGQVLCQHLGVALDFLELGCAVGAAGLDAVVDGVVEGVAAADAVGEGCAVSY